MKILSAAFIVGLTVSGSALAAQSVTDMDYIKASRCKGLADGSGLTDTKGLDDYLKAAGRRRIELAQDRAQSEYDRARRSTRSDEGKAHYAAELAGACAPYMNGGQMTASTGSPKDTASH